jgi:hypothetical protein
LFFPAVKPVPRHNRFGVLALCVVRHKRVAPEHFVVILPPRHRRRKRELTVLGRVSDAGVLLGHFPVVAPGRPACRTPDVFRQRHRRAFGHRRPFVVADAPVREAGGVMACKYTVLLHPLSARKSLARLCQKGRWR